MSEQRLNRQKWFAIFAMTTVITQCTFISQSFGQAENATLVRVEEDWIALVGEPDSATSSPQILNVISPTSNLDGIFGMIQLNHRSEPSFQEGGQQVQGWVGTTCAGAASGTKTAILYRTSDSIRYTVAMAQVPQGIRFELLNGRSRTWGRFCSTPITLIVPATDNSIASYSADNSVSNTTVALGAHRLSALYITTTRKTYSDGTVITDGTDRFVHRYQLSVDDVPPETYEANPEEYEVDITEQ